MPTAEVAYDIPSHSRIKPRRKNRDRRPRVLCVDDDKDLTRILSARLHRSGFCPTIAGNGRDASKLAKSHRPIAVITDLQMDRGDGLYLVRKLRSRRCTADIPIIVVTGAADESRIAVATEFNVDAVLRKPVEFDDILRILEPHIPNSQEAHSARRKADEALDSLAIKKRRFFRRDITNTESHPKAEPRLWKTDRRFSS